MNDRIVTRLAEAEEVTDLRHRVLRATLPRESAMFDLDAAPDSFHLAAFDGNRAVCSATFHPGEWAGEPSWHLRGMATDAEHRGLGLGRRVLAAAERFMAVHPMDNAGIVRLIWANCRLVALNFYQAQGWSIASELFDIPSAGPHYKMFKRVTETPLLDASDRLETRASGTGRGVFATAPIEPCTVLLQYVGPILKYEQTTPQTLALQVGPDAYIGESGGLDDFVNHSCEPNAGMIVRDQSDVKLIALRDIAAGEQVLFDYSTTMDEDDFEFDCACGAEKCRGRVGDFKHLPIELRRRYQSFGGVPGYNRKYV